MKKQLRKLDLLFRFTKLEPEMFYCITFWDDSINLQGKAISENIKTLKKMFGNGTISDDGYVEFSKNDIKITLT